jgi:hypothetical protein
MENYCQKEQLELNSTDSMNEAIHIQPHNMIIIETDSILNKSDQTEVKEINEIEVPQQF